MSVCTHIVDGPIGRDAGVAIGDAPDHDGRAGAVIRFEGVVRRLEPRAPNEQDERALEALDYQTYDPMTARELHALARSVAEAHGLLSILVLHSRGRVAVGEVSFVLEVMAPHRSEALRAMGDFIDRLKREVPIWKRPVWAG